MNRVLHSYELAVAVRDEGRDAFIARFQQPFLLQLADNDADSVERSFKTVVAQPTTAMKLAREGYEITVDLARVTLYVVAKDPNNPWKDRIIVGRARNSDVSIDHASISKVHAYITQQDGEYAIIDANSRNGTWINGQQVSQTERAKLKLGAQVRLGAVALEFIDAASVYERFKDGILKRP